MILLKMIFNRRIRLESQSLIILAEISSGPWALIEDKIFSVMEEKFSSVLMLPVNVFYSSYYHAFVCAAEIPNFSIEFRRRWNF